MMTDEHKDGDEFAGCPAQLVWEILMAGEKETYYRDYGDWIFPISPS